MNWSKVIALVDRITELKNRISRHDGNYFTLKQLLRKAALELAEETKPVKEEK